MRFHFGAAPISQDLTADPSWKSLRGPSPRMEKLVWPATGLVAAAVVAVLWLAITPLQTVLPATMSWPAFLVSFAGIVVVHELLHAVVHPKLGLSPRSMVGFWPSKGFYAHYDGELTRNRFVAVLVMPLVVISLIPLLVAAVTQVPMGWAAFISTFNVFLACADIFDTGLVLFQIPATAVVRTQAVRIYWRENETTPA